MNEQSIQIAVGSPEYFLIRDLLEFGRDVYKDAVHDDASEFAPLRQRMGGLPGSTLILIVDGLNHLFAPEAIHAKSAIGQYMTEILRKAAHPVIVVEPVSPINNLNLTKWLADHPVNHFAREAMAAADGIDVDKADMAAIEASDALGAASISSITGGSISAAGTICSLLSDPSPAPIIEPLTVDQRPARDLLIEILKTTDQSMRAPLVTIALWKRYGRRPNYPTHVGGELNRLSRDRSTGIVSVGRGFYKYVEPSKPAAPPAVTSTVSRETCNQCGKLFPLKDLGEHKRQAHPISDRPDMREERSHTGSSLGNPR